MGKGGGGGGRWVSGCSGEGRRGDVGEREGGKDGWGVWIWVGELLFLRKKIER